MGRWYKHAERKRISQAKYNRISERADAVAGVVPTYPAFRLKYNIPFSLYKNEIAGYLVEGYFYYQHLITKNCYRFNVNTRDGAILLWAVACEELSNRDWELIEIDHIIHGRSLNWKLLPSYRIPLRTETNAKYRAYLLSKLKTTALRDDLKTLLTQQINKRVVAKEEWKDEA